MMTGYRAPLALRAIVVAAGLVVAAALPAAAQSAAPTPQSPSPLPRVTVNATRGLSDSMRVELAGHLADSATLASMSSRERVLRLEQDNRYLDHVRRDQDKRIDALEKRVKELAAERARIRAAYPTAPNDSGAVRASRTPTDSTPVVGKPTSRRDDRGR